MRSFCTILALLPLAAFPGCKGTTSAQGQNHDTQATYRFRRLTADLPATVRIPAVMAAAKTSLLERGYAIREYSSSEFQGHLSAEPPQADLFESISIAADTSGGGTHIRIIAQPVGDQARSRAILDSILAKLSM